MKKEAPLAVFIILTVIFGGIVAIANSERTVTETAIEKISYKTKTVEDDSIEYGKTKVRTTGIKGEKNVTYDVTYKGNKEKSRKLVKEEVIKQPTTEIIAKGTKIVWHCKDTTSFDKDPSNDNLCTNSTGERRSVDDCTAVSLDPSYHPGQSGPSYYNGCAW